MRGSDSISDVETVILHSNRHVGVVRRQPVGADDAHSVLEHSHRVLAVYVIATLLVRTGRCGEIIAKEVRATGRNRAGHKMSRKML